MDFIETVVQDGEIVRFDKSRHWPVGKHKLVIFFPEAFTPVCESELGELQGFIKAFEKEDTFVAAACTDPIADVREWFRVDSDLKGSTFPVFSSYRLAREMGVLDPSLRAKRASVFVMTSGETVVQEYFFKVSRSLNELHRQVYAFNHGSDKDWKAPNGT